MSDHLSNSQIRQIMVRHKGDQQMLPEYLPPEAQNGKGADEHTELLGFKRDFDAYIQGTLEKFPTGASRDDLAKHLTEQADMQGDTSAGPYLRATLLEVREIIAPGYGQPKQESNVMDAATAIEALKQKHSDRESWTILHEAEQQLPRQNATAEDLTRALRHVGDDYQKSGDDYMAETADILRDSLKGIQAQPAAAPKPAVKAPPPPRA